MSDTVSFAELDGQHVELLPARTVLSMFSTQGGGLWDGLGLNSFLEDGLGGLFGGQTGSSDGNNGESKK